MIPRQNAVRFGPKEIQFPVGKTLYHGTLKKLASGFPSRPSGNWFATDPRQAMFHALQSAEHSNTKVPYMYIYKVIQSPRVLRFASPVNFNRYAKAQGFELPEGLNTFAFSSQNYQVAKKLCENGTYDGWWFPEDQTQVMLCNPSKFLKFVKVLQIKRPAKGFYEVKFKNGMWTKNNINKFTTVPAKLNNIININQPPSTSLYYYYTRPNYQYKFIDVNGIPVNVNKSKKTFIYKNKTYMTHGSMSSSITNDPNRKKAQIISNRIKARTGENVNVRNIGQFFLNNGKRNFKEIYAKRAALNNYYNRLTGAKPTNVTNLNASSLYR